MDIPPLLLVTLINLYTASLFPFFKINLSSLSILSVSFFIVSSYAFCIFMLSYLSAFLILPINSFTVISVVSSSLSPEISFFLIVPNLYAPPKSGTSNSKSL